jgi:hypothetical protein
MIFFLLLTSVLDPHEFYADPYPAQNLDQGSQKNADLNPGPYKKVVVFIIFF